MSAGEPFAPGSLRAAVAAATARGRAAGALQPIPTEHVFLEERGVRFLVRILATHRRKQEERKEQERAAAAGEPVNPFLPYERDLFVAAVSETHVGILNKFQVVEDHLLIVTRAFEEQRSLLARPDFEALWRCLAEYDSLGFYNGGPEAGASQRHKHLQLVPLPLAPEGPPVPMAPLLAAAGGRGSPAAVPGLDFLHAFVRLGGDPASGPGEALDRYLELLDATGSRERPYCLLATREWMLLVPRSREHFRSISVNSLGFAGALLVWNDGQLRELEAAGPFAALRETAYPRAQGRGVV